MKKIAIIGKGLSGREIFGIHRNTNELLRCLDKIVSDDKIVLLIPGHENDTYHFEHIKVVPLGPRRSPSNALLARAEAYLYKNVLTNLYCKMNNAISVDMLLQFPSYGCDVITIYDCIPELFPEHYVIRGNVEWRKKLLARESAATKKARLVLADSESAKADVERFYQVPEDRIKVIPCGWQHFERIQPDETILDRLGLRNKPYFFSLGSRFPHKNIKWISYAAEKNRDYTFVITGSEQICKERGFEGEKLDNMLFTGYLSDSEIKALMKHCKAFIQPSLYEGFGIPPMEAMSVGADCIVSTGGSLPEVYKNSVWYIDPYDYEHIDLDEIMSRPKESNELILNEYSWEKSAKILYGILCELAR